MTLSGKKVMPLHNYKHEFADIPTTFNQFF